VWNHRIVLDAEAEFEGTSSLDLLERVLSEVPAPQERRNVA